jgi:endoglucanase
MSSPVVVSSPLGLSAALPPLDTSGRHIVSGATGEPLRLCGVNRSGLESAEPDGQGFLEAAGITAEEIAAIAEGWGARILRLPFNQDFAVRGRKGHSPMEYLEAIDHVIAWAARHGCYTLLDLQWLDADRVFGMNADFTFNRVPPLPDAWSVQVWAMLALRYRDEPAVLFDLFNEPHSPLPDDDHELYGVVKGEVVPLPGRRVTMAEWQPWAHHLIATIREHHPAALIFVSGVRWAYDLRGIPLTDAAGAPLSNVVYSTHVYPWSRTAPVRLGPLERDWDRAFGRLAEHAPVFVGEWGGGDEQVDWGRRLRAYLDSRQIGWAAWSWADRPCLVTSCRERDYSPTAFGTLVHDALQEHLTSGSRNR